MNHLKCSFKELLGIWLKDTVFPVQDIALRCVMEKNLKFYFLWYPQVFVQLCIQEICRASFLGVLFCMFFFSFCFFR